MASGHKLLEVAGAEGMRVESVGGDNANWSNYSLIVLAVLGGLMWLVGRVIGQISDWERRQRERGQTRNLDNLGAERTMRMRDGQEGERNKVAQKIPSGCSGCSHLHGQVYGGNLLVCGLHPYGQEDCADYE